ncbi:hypothetical protein NDU88_005527 [Pleurodeles waltl]|uniref:Uncharacterized protein n=1 Tax=Pleurodeles waltl TaxID=8319 RepID=A0AAV7MZL9_PLEWA|nr:hypothetical protein NDU88_005527 [Pleurodeles waltl]
MRNKQHYWWPVIVNRVRFAIDKCSERLLSDKQQKVNKTPLQPVVFPDVAWEKIGLQILFVPEVKSTKDRLRHVREKLGAREDQGADLAPQGLAEGVREERQWVEPEQRRSGTELRAGQARSSDYDVNVAYTLRLVDCVRCSLGCGGVPF